MDTFEVSLEVILVAVLGIVAERGGLEKLFELLDPFLRGRELDFPRFVPQELNANFNTRFELLVAELARETSAGIRLSDIDPNFPSPEVSTIPLLICSNFAPRGSRLLELCDEPFARVGLELLTCGVQTIPPGVDVPSHRETYFGYFSYYLVLEGDAAATISIAQKSYQLSTKSSLLFDPTAPRSISNRSERSVRILCCEFRRPLDRLGTQVNSVAMKVLAISRPVMRACEISWGK